MTTQPLSPMTVPFFHRWYLPPSLGTGERPGQALRWSRCSGDRAVAGPQPTSHRLRQSPPPPSAAQWDNISWSAPRQCRPVSPVPPRWSAAVRCGPPLRRSGKGPRSQGKNSTLIVTESTVIITGNQPLDRVKPASC